MPNVSDTSAPSSTLSRSGAGRRRLSPRRPERDNRCKSDGRARQLQPTAPRVARAATRDRHCSARRVLRRAGNEFLELHARVADVLQSRFGSLFRHRRSSRRRRSGTSAGSARQSGSVFSTDANVSEIVSPLKSRWPVSISNSTTPNAQMSARLSTGFASRLLRDSCRPPCRGSCRRRSSARAT